jgi:hypothetical protein
MKSRNYGFFQMNTKVILFCLQAQALALLPRALSAGITGILDKNNFIRRAAFSTCGTYPASCGYYRPARTRDMRGFEPIKISYGHGIVKAGRDLVL